MYMYMYVWPGDVMVRFDSRPFVPLSGNNLRQVVAHTCASVTKQYNLVPVRER